MPIRLQLGAMMGMSDQILLDQLIVREALKSRREMLFSRREKGWEQDETYLTSRLINEWSRTGGSRVQADRVPGRESTHGADLELWLRGGGLYLGLRLQAKKLFPSGKGRSPGTYKELHHLVGHTAGKAQVQVLIDATPSPLNPGYLFYNGLERKPRIDDGCCTLDGYERTNGRLGLTVTSAEFVKSLYDLSPQKKSLGAVLPHSVPLQCLVLCRRQYRWRNAGMPLDAALPLDLAGFRRLLVVPDLDFEGRSPELDVTGGAVVISDDPLPPYVRRLALDGRLGNQDLPEADFVVVLSSSD